MFIKKSEQVFFNHNSSDFKNKTVVFRVNVNF